MQEYEYMKCAEKCGIDVPEVRLLPSKIYKGYYAVKRFDRTGNKKLHMITASGLLETSHRYPNLDYLDLMKLTSILTKDNLQVQEMFRRMCFNVFAHNRDDHSKNFTYIYNEKIRSWKLSPVYDLTFSESIGGEHATCVNGNGKNPGMKDILQAAGIIGLPKTWAEITAEDIKEVVRRELKAYSV